MNAVLENTATNINDPRWARIATYIDDAIALEAASITGLEDFISDAQDTEDAALYREHLAETQHQKMLLEARLQAMGEKAHRNVFKDLINKVGAAATDILHAAKTPHEKATRNLMEAYAIENLEVAVYQALRAAALEVGDEETARLAEQIQGEEKAAAEKVFARINSSARLGVDAPE